jgi:sortase (surface protein transpeptidase)
LRATSGATSHVTPAKTASPVRYAGRNHVWIPSLGINRSVSSFSCTRSRPPDNYVYRWGCAGRNNVYLLGHAYSVFRPLHDAYVGGRLRKGLKAVYADALGHVHTYAVTWWRVVAPTTAASWAWAAQSRPSMTLQTCVGARSQYRLMVRLVEVG